MGQNIKNLTDGPRDVPEGVVSQLHTLVDLAGLLHQLGLVLHEREHRNLDGGHAGVEAEKSSLLSSNLRMSIRIKGGGRRQSGWIWWGEGRGDVDARGMTEKLP